MIFKKKKYGGLVSVEKGANIAYSVGDAGSWVTIKNGSLLQIEDQQEFYPIVETQSESLEFNFEKSENNKILIKNNIVGLNENDTLFIDIKEYQFFTLTGIVSGGSGYQENDILEIQSGHPFIDVNTNSSCRTSFKVISVDENGTIVKLRPIEKGKYINNVFGPSLILSGGSGFGAEISAEFELSGKSASFEKNIIQVERSPSFTFITFSTPLPSYVTSGSFKFSKWKMTLASPYLGKSAKSASYSIVRDFTPHNGYPLMAIDSTSPEAIYNESMIKLDKKIQELEQRIAKLEN